jgi:hypothetical protein
VKRERMSLVFFVAYTVFLFPLILALSREFFGNVTNSDLDIACAHLKGIPLVRTLCIWLIFLLTSYVVLNFIPKIKRKTKSFSMHIDDILKLFIFGTMLFVIGGIGDRIDKSKVNTETGMTFIPLTIYYSLFFTLLYELIKHENVTLSKELASNKLALIITIIGATTLAGVIISLFTRAQMVSDEFFHAFVGLFVVGSIIHVGSIILAPIIDECHPHVHHYYWPLPFTFMCVFHSDVAMIAQAIFIGIHLHGVNCFGFEPLFYDAADHDVLAHKKHNEDEIKID